jgi:hypothetical protein
LSTLAVKLAGSMLPLGAGTADVEAGAGDGDSGAALADALSPVAAVGADVAAADTTGAELGVAAPVAQAASEASMTTPAASAPARVGIIGRLLGSDVLLGRSLGSSASA